MERILNREVQENQKILCWEKTQDHQNASSLTYNCIEGSAKISLLELCSLACSGMPNACFRPLEGLTALSGCVEAVLRGVSPKVSLATYKAINSLHILLKLRLSDHILEFILFLTCSFIKDVEKNLISFYIKPQTCLNET